MGFQLEASVSYSLHVVQDAPVNSELSRISATQMVGRVGGQVSPLFCPCPVGGRFWIPWLCTCSPSRLNHPNTTPHSGSVQNWGDKNASVAWVKSQGAWIPCCRWHTGGRLLPAPLWSPSMSLDSTHLFPGLSPTKCVSEIGGCSCI